MKTCQWPNLMSIVNVLFIHCCSNYVSGFCAGSLFPGVFIGVLYQDSS